MICLKAVTHKLAAPFMQPNHADFAVFYKAVRTYGVPEVLVSDNGSVFI